MTDSSILITGGTGFIGSRLALDLTDRGGRVRVFGLENTEAEAWNVRLLRDRGIEVCLGSVAETLDLETVMTDVDVVFHLAAAQHEMNVPDEHFRRVNVEGASHVVEAAVSAGVGRLVHGSTIGVYGDPDGTIDADTPPEPVNIYGRTKLEGEAVALAAAERLHVTVVRIPEVYGPGDRRLLKLFRMIHRRRFFIIGSGRNLHHPMFVDDLVAGLRAAATRDLPSGSVVPLAGAEVVETRQMAGAVARALGRREPGLRVPLWPFQLAAVVMETTLRPLGVQPPLHRRRLDFFRKSFALSTEPGRRILGFEPVVGFDEGIRATAGWYVQQGLLPPIRAD